MKSLKYWQSLVLTCLFLFAAPAAFAQAAEKSSDNEKLGIFVIRSDKGYLIVNNRETNSYSLEFRGDQFKPIEGEHPIFLVDGKLVQIVAVKNKDYYVPKTGAKNEPTDDELLETHKVWESEYLGKAMKSKLSVNSEITEIAGKRKVMYWSFPMPKELGSDYSHQIFMTTLIGKDILALNASPRSEAEQKSYRDYLTETLKTLKVSEKPFNIKELQTFLKKGDDAE